MENALTFNGNLEMRDEAGHTSRYVVAPAEQLQALQAECGNLRQQVAAQQVRIQGLEQEIQALRREHQATAAERDEFRHSLHAILRERATVDEARLEAEILEAERTGVPAAEVLRELESLSKDARPGG
jgi:septal ring factor EnvC (AmiA/AmiB activator)